MSANGHGAPDLHAAHRALGPRKPDGGSFTEMTLRDFFAGKALHGLLAFGWGVDVVAEKAYAVADAMLTERDKRAEPTP